MRSMRILLTFLFFLNATLFFGQHQDLIKYQNLYPKENKVILKDHTDIRISFNENDSLIIDKTTEREVLFLDKDAGKHAKASISSSYFQELTSLEAATFLPNGNKKYKKEEVVHFEKKSVLDDMIFYDDSKTTYFTYPNLREGAKTYIKYTTRLETPQLLTGTYFGSFSPTETQTYRVTHPKNVSLSFKKFNGIDSLVSYKMSEKDGMKIHFFEAKNLPVLHYEASAPPIQSYIPMIYPIIKNYSIDDQHFEVLGTTKKLHDWYTILLALQDTTTGQSLKNTADSLAKGLEREISIVEEVHQWVQKNIKYVAYEDGLGGFVPRSPQLVYNRKFGDCKDMSTIQVAMLQHLGIKAHIGWVGTRDIPYTYEELPTVACDNHMIAMYKSQKGTWYVLDATGAYTPFEYPSEFIQGKEVMVHLESNKYEIVKIEPVLPEKNKTHDISKLRISGRDLVGEGEVSYSGYPLIDLKYRVLESDSLSRANFFKAQLQKGSNKFYFTFKNFKTQGNNTAKTTYGYEIKDYLSSYNDEIYINLNLEKLLADTKIDDTRKLPITSDYLNHVHNTYILDLEGVYKIDFLPESLSIDNDQFKVEIKYTEKEGKIQYDLILVHKSLVTNPSDFDTWNDTIKKLNKKYKEVIVLKKK